MPGLEDRFTPPDNFSTAIDLLHELVAKEVGSDDFGSDNYLPGLKVLLLSMDYDPHFSERGRRIAWGLVVSTLLARVRAIASMKQTPGFDRNIIKQPIVITGIPRTGTTALHKLMAVDPQFQGLQGWLITAPQPRPAIETWASIPAFQDTVERLEASFASRPGARAAHNMVAEEVDECLGVLRQGFVSNLWSCAWSSATYDLWLQTQSERHCYQYLKQVLQLIGNNEPGKRWLLKNPGHIANLDQLFATFPDALVIHTHRDPAKAIPSLCGLLIKSHLIMEQGRKALRANIMGIRETEKWAKAIRDAELVRATHSQQILDIDHSDFHREPMKIIEAIYQFTGTQLTDSVAAAMQQRIAENPEGQHGVHHYDMAEFGLSKEAIHERFGDYMGRFK